MGEIGDDLGWDIFFGMLDASGVELWTESLAGANDGNVEFDPNGSLLVTTGIGGVTEDVWAAKYDPIGLEIWSNVYDSGMIDAGRAVVADAVGNVFVTGLAQLPGSNIFVRKYDPDGVVLWTDLVNGAADQTDFGRGVAIAANGDLVVGGGVIREVPICGDSWLRRYEPDGTPLWTQTYAGTADEGDGIADVAAAADGTFLVCGIVTDVEGTRRWLAKVETDGQSIWERRLGSGEWLDVAVSLDGRIAVAGTVSLPFPWDAEGRFAVYPL